MALPLTETGGAVFLVALLLMMGDAPVPTIAPEDVEGYEGRTVMIAGFVDDVEIGIEDHRGIIHRDGHGIRFQAPGTIAPDEGSWAELRGTLHRDRGYLTLHVEPDPWIR